MAKKENNNIIIKEIKVDGEAWEKALDTAFKKKNKEVEIKGFRKGKAPKDRYLAKYGIVSLFDEAIEEVIDGAYKNAHTDDLELMAQPRADVKDVNEEGVLFEFTFFVKPEFKIKKYKDLGIKLEDAKVTKKEVDQEIEHLLEHYTELVLKTDEIKKGDIAIIDYEGLKDGVAFDGGTAEGYSLEIGSDTFIPGFEDALIGLKKGDKKDVKLSFPKDYHAKDLAGEEVVFKVKINEVKEKLKRKLDKDLFEDIDMDGVNDEKSLRDKIKEDLESKKNSELENEFYNKIFDKIIKDSDIKIADEVIHEEAHNQMHNYLNRLKMQGLDPNMYFQMTGQSEEALVHSLEPEAKKNLETKLVMDELIKLEDIKIDDKDLDKHIKTRSEELGMSEEELIQTAGGTKEFFRREKEIMTVLESLKKYNN